MTGPTYHILGAIAAHMLVIQLASIAHASPVLDQQYELWLPSFRAADPAYQDWCMNILRTRQGSSSELEQDVFVFFNFFKYWPMESRKGFYIDSGANEARDGSNTFFYDKCLGWRGICIEPQAQYHDGIRRLRSCTLVTDCISSKKTSVKFTNGGPGGGITEHGSNTVTCSPLSEILASNNVTRHHIDFWSLDVEGHELTILESLDFKALTIHVLLMEDYWLSLRDVDMLLTSSGFYKYHQLAVDSVYVHRNLASQRGLVWYPINWKKNVERFRLWRTTPEVKARLKCNW